MVYMSSSEEDIRTLSVPCNWTGSTIKLSTVLNLFKLAALVRTAKFGIACSVECTCARIKYVPLGRAAEKHSAYCMDLEPCAKSVITLLSVTEKPALASEASARLYRRRIIRAQ